ncbi:MAG TPA: nuclear transport factor 2 family protein [Allosphingosinicella sp.]
MIAGSFRAASIVLFLALASPAAAGHGSSAVEALPPAARAPAETVDAFHAALGRGATEAALALLAEDALIFEEGRAERSKAEYAAHHLGADAAFSQAVPAVRTRRRGDAAADLAWIATEGRTKGSYKGTDVNRVTAETMLLRRVGEAWKIVHIHWSSAQASTE